MRENLGPPCHQTPNPLLLTAEKQAFQHPPLELPVRKNLHDKELKLQTRLNTDWSRVPPTGAVLG